MKDIVNLYDLLLEQLRDLYSAEYQQLEVLPEFREGADSFPLCELIDDHVRETKRQVDRLTQIFNDMSVKAEGQECRAMKGLIEEAHNLMGRSADPEVLDAGLVTSIQHINHYEIAGYGTAIAYAKALGHHTIAASLLETLREEKQSDTDLTELAEKKINERAKRTGISKNFME